MNETNELLGLTRDPIDRRVWLLSNALRCLAFDQALEAARAAEAFVIGRGLDETDGAQADATAPNELVADHPAQKPEEISHVANPNGAALGTKRSGFALSEDARERLIGQLAEGAKNAELAAELGLSPRQVQGLRMGCAREIAERRAQLNETRSDADPAPPATALADDIVRYLRQQDDVVVPLEDDRYLVNGRFPMTVRELLARANRMRRRQQKPAFELLGGTPVPTETIARGNGHPLFWDNASISERPPPDLKDIFQSRSRRRVAHR